MQNHSAARSEFGFVMNAPRNDSDLAPENRMRVLVVEDQFLVAIQLEDDLKAAGFSVVGPFTDLESATQASRQEEFDVAVLDANLNGTMSFPLADELTARKIPFVLLTGYGAASLPERFRGGRRLTKPCDVAALLAEIRRAAEAQASP